MVDDAYRLFRQRGGLADEPLELIELRDVESEAIAWTVIALNVDRDSGGPAYEWDQPVVTRREAKAQLTEAQATYPKDDWRLCALVPVVDKPDRDD